MLGISDAVELAKKVGDLVKTGATIGLQESIMELREAMVFHSSRRVRLLPGVRCMVRAGLIIGVMAVGAVGLRATIARAADKVPTGPELAGKEIGGKHSANPVLFAVI